MTPHLIRDVREWGCAERMTKEKSPVVGVVPSVRHLFVRG